MNTLIIRRWSGILASMVAFTITSLSILAEAHQHARHPRTGTPDRLGNPS